MKPVKIERCLKTSLQFANCSIIRFECAGPRAFKDHMCPDLEDTDFSPLNRCPAITCVTEFEVASLGAHNYS
jgi:hypothetical protein